MTESRLWVTVFVEASVGVLILVVETLGRETVELAGSSVEMEIVVIELVTSMVDVPSKMTLVPYTFSQSMIRSIIFLRSCMKRTPASVVVRLMVLVKLCTTSTVVTIHFSKTLVQS